MNNRYQKPMMFMEKFMAQEYCAICDQPLTNLNSYLHIDWNPNGTEGYFDRGSEYMNSSGIMSGSTDGKYNNVKIYKLQQNYRTNTNYSWEGWKDSTQDLAVSHDYSTDEFTTQYSPNTRKYKFVLLGTYDIMIKDRKVYYNQS